MAILTRGSLNYTVRMSGALCNHRGISLKRVKMTKEELKKLIEYIWYEGYYWGWADGYYHENLEDEPDFDSMLKDYLEDNYEKA